MLKFFSINVYSLLDPSATLYFLTPLVAKNFNNLSDILHEPFLVATPVCDSIVAKREYRICPIMLPNRVSNVYLVKLDMLDIDIILVWLIALLFCHC